jgi:hypothetical protein
VGRYLYPAWFRWLLFIWCLLLLDMLTIAACMGGRVPDRTGYLLVAAQINLLTFWAILGSGTWQVRLPAVLVGASATILLCFAISGFWSSQAWAFTMMLAPLVGGALCIGLRLFGFQLRPAHRANSSTSDDATLQRHQFGLRHLFLWATAVVPLLLASRGVDYLFFVPWIDGESVFVATLLAVSIATINLLAIWCVLGAGWWIARLACLFLIPLLIAAGFTFYSYFLELTYGGWTNVPMLDAFIETRDDWFVWLWTSAALLAALLLFFRAAGYRLTRLP